MNPCFKRQSIMALSLAIGLLSACSLDPSVRKQKYYQNGQAFFEKGEYNAAVAEYSHATKVDPGYADAHFQLGESYMLLQQPDRAYQEFARTIELQPANYQARLAMAHLAILSRNFQPAKEQTDWLLKQRPSDPAVHSAVSSLQAQQGNIPAAIEEMQKTILLSPGYWQPYLSLALLQAKDNQTDAAEASFKKVIAMDPKEAQPRVLLGRYYQSQGRLTDAEQQFRDAMAAVPGNMAPREALAKLYVAEGKTSDAGNILLQASQDLPHDPGSLLALSNFYFTTGNLDKAVSVYNALYQERPKDLTVKKKYIQLLIQTKHYEQAQQLDAEILKVNSGDSDALVYRSQMQINQGDVNDAAQTLQTVVNNAPNDSQAHYALGVALEKQGYAARALSEWRQALNLNPDLLDAERAIADEAMLDGDMNALQDAANQMIRLEPEAPEGYALRALSSINRRQFDAAERDVQRAIATAPQGAFGYVEMGNLRFAQKQYSDAAKAYQDALDRNSGSIDALRGLMNAYVAEKQPEKAIAAAKAQIGKSPNNAGFYDLLGAALFHFTKDMNGAEAALEKSVAFDGHNPDAVIQLCQVQGSKGEIDQAIATGVQAVKQNPRESGVYIVLGDLYVAKSDWKAAENAYQGALAINSLNPIAASDLANVMLHTGESLDAALALVQTARRASPHSPAIADTMGWIYYQKGQYQLALSSLEDALNIETQNQMPDDPDIRFHLGMAYVKTKQPALARQNLEQVLKTNPDYSGADEIRAQLLQLKS